MTDCNIVTVTVNKQLLDEDWSIKTAMNSDWTHLEQNPPSNSDFERWTDSVNLAVPESLIATIDGAKREFGISSTHHCVKRMLRVGITVLVGELQNGLGEMMRYRAAASTARDYYRGKGEYGLIKSQNKLGVDWGQTVDEPSWNIIWYQKQFLAKLATEVGITEADAVRIALYLTADKMGTQGIIGPGLHADVERVLDDIEDSLIKRRKRVIRISKRLAKIALTEEHAEGFISTFESQYPEVFNEVQSEIESRSEVLENSSDEFLSDYL